MAIARDFGFIGRLCLDLAHTGDMGYGTQFERLTSPAELRRWLLLSRLRLPSVKINSEDMQNTKMLRGAVWRIAGAILQNTTPAAADIRLINRMGQQPGLVRELGIAAKSMHWHHPVIGAALATIAQDAVMLFGEPNQRIRLRRCENPGCKVVFYDDSRPGLRRWCASNRCGDRMRAKSYRKRHKAQDV